MGPYRPGPQSYSDSLVAWQSDEDASLLGTHAQGASEGFESTGLSALQQVTIASALKTCCTSVLGSFSCPIYETDQLLLLQLSSWWLMRLMGARYPLHSWSECEQSSRRSLQSGAAHPLPTAWTTVWGERPDAEIGTSLVPVHELRHTAMAAHQ